VGHHRIRTCAAFIAIAAVALAAFAAPAAAVVREHLPHEVGSSNPAYVVAAKPGGEVYEFGAARFVGSTSAIDPPGRPVGMAVTSSSAGYWIAYDDGTVHAFGDAREGSSVPDLPADDPVVDIASSAAGRGYWLLTSGGRVLAHGGSWSYGDEPPEDAKAVAIESTASGRGYWVLSSTGAIQAFGDAEHLGDFATSGLIDPVDIVRAGDLGYWVVGRGGTVQSFGDAPQVGSAPLLTRGDFVGAASAGDTGLWLTAANGHVIPLGTARQFGGALAGPDEPIIDIVPAGAGTGYWLLTGRGSSWLGPEPPEHSGTGQRIVYALAEQRIWLINADDSVFDSYLVSGKAGTPRPGDYSVYSKSRNAFAAHDGITMDHMVRFAHGKTLAIGFHSIPIYANGRPMQTVDELGSYRSAGCVRQRNDQAERLYNWAPLGTPVLVVP